MSVKYFIALLSQRTATLNKIIYSLIHILYVYIHIYGCIYTYIWMGICLMGQGKGKRGKPLDPL